MSEFKYERILLVTDGFSTSTSVQKSALNIAKRNGASVKIIDTVREPSVASRWLSVNANDVFEMVLADKNDRLNRVADRFRAEGIEVETEVRFGKSSEAITKQAIELDASLVVRYMKGARSKYSGQIGGTARALMRYCPSPLLLVGKEPVDSPRVLACIDVDHEEKENGAIVRHASKLVGDHRELSGVYCWEMYGREQFQKRMDEAAFAKSLEHTEAQFRRCFDRFVEKHDLSMFEGGVRMENGEPSKVIPSLCREEGIDVVVMCSAALNHPLRRYFGSTVESVIEALPCSLLVVKPIGFISPLVEKATA